MRKGQYLQIANNCLCCRPLHYLINIPRQSKHRRVVDLWHFAEERSEFFLILRDGGIEANGSFSVDHEQVEVLL